jgi:CHAD domain-containing protein
MVDQRNDPLTSELEHELKFRVDEDVPWERIQGLVIERSDVVQFDAEYFDTADLCLLSLGHTLRLRGASDGSAPRWTLKLALAGSVRRELNVVAPEGSIESNRVPEFLRWTLHGVIDDEPLVPVASITTRRKRRHTRYRKAVIEIAVDDVVGVPRNHGSVGPVAFRQIELELLEGDDEALAHLAETLEQRGAQPWQQSKLEIVLAEVAHSVHSAHLAPVVLDGRATVDALVRHAVVQGLRQLLVHEPHLRGEPSVESVHRARVATRRLRSDLATLRPLLDAAEVAQARDELAWLGGVIGGVRDLDVLDGHIDDWLEQFGGASGAAQIRTLLREQRDRAVVELHVALDSERARALAASLRMWATTPPWAIGVHPKMRATRLARSRTRQAYRRLATRVDDLDQPPMDASLHELRKRAKRLRYAAELCSPVLHHRLDGLASAATSMQEVLGGLQDAAMMNRWFESVDVRSLPPAEAFDAGQIVQLATGRAGLARAQWGHEWRRVRRRAEDRLG